MMEMNFQIHSYIFNDRKPAQIIFYPETGLVDFLHIIFFSKLDWVNREPRKSQILTRLWLLIPFYEKKFKRRDTTKPSNPCK